MSTLPKVLTDLEARSLELTSFVPDGTDEPMLSTEDAQPLVLPEIEILNGESTSQSGEASSEEISAEDLMETAAAEARRLIEEAEKRSADVLEAAHEKAMLEFNQKLHQATEENTREIREAYAGAINSIDSLSSNLTKTLTHELVGLVTTIAEKVVRTELNDRNELIMEILNNAISKVNEISVAEIHLNPEDLSLVEELKDDVEFKGIFELHGDKTIDRGGCLIKTESGDIDARIDAQFEEIRNSLLND